MIGLNLCFKRVPLAVVLRIDSRGGGQERKQGEQATEVMQV